MGGIKDSDIKNIALTGDLSTGKSSLIKSFKAEYSNKKYLDISLADFCHNEKEGDSEDKEIECNIENVEKKILQQMLYSVKNNKIPFSKFSKIEELKYHKIKTFLIVLTLISGYLYFNIEKFLSGYSSIKRILGNSMSVLEGETALVYLRVLFFSLLIVILSFMIYEGIKLTKKIKITSFSFGGADVVANGNNKGGDSFDEHLDEILYYFESVGTEIVIIEDLDRLSNAHKLFIKLRELNQLINNAEQVKQKVTFIFALGNDIFSDGRTQTKFFDLIIPIMPVVDYSNSESYIAERIEKYKLKEIDAKLIRDISLYVNDPRLIINTFNEFIVYKEQLELSKDKNRDTEENSMSINLNKLFALSLYKSIYPIGYSQLIKKEGMLYSILSNKKKYIESLNEKFEIELETLKMKIKEVEKESFSNIQDLNKIFIFEAIKKLKLRTNVYLSGIIFNNSSSFEDLEKSHDLKITLGENFYVVNHSFTFKFIDIDKIVSYSERFDNIKKKELKEKKIIEDKISDLKKRILQNKHKELKDMVLNLKSIIIESLKEKYNISSEIILEEFNLIFYLLKEGYIAEDYDLYISAPNSQEMDQKTLKFIKNVKDDENLDFNYSLDEHYIKRILKNGRLSENDFKGDVILNWHLLKCFLEDIQKSSNDLSMYKKFFFEKLADEKDRTLDFINYVIENLKNLEAKNDIYLKIFINELYNSWTNMVNFITLKPDLIKNLYLLIKYIPNENIRERDEFNSLIEQEISFADLCYEQNIDVEKIKDFLNNLNIKLKSLSFQNKLNPIFEVIIDNSYYELNYSNIETIFKYKNLEISDLKEKNYTAILSSEYEPLKKYIEDNFNDYLRIITNTHEISIDESQEVLDMVIKQCNKENQEDILTLLSKQSTPIKNLELKNEWLEKELVRTAKIDISWKNIIYYYEKYGKILDEIIIEYLNREEVYKKLPTLSISNEVLEEKFQKDLCENKELTVKALKAYLEKFRYILDSYQMNLIPDEKLKLMICMNVVELTVPYVEFLKENNRNQMYQLIITHFKEFRENYTEYKLENSDYEELFKLEKNIENKKKIISLIDLNLSKSLTEKFLIDVLNFIKIYKDIEISDDLLITVLKIQSEEHLDIKLEVLNRFIGRFEKEALVDILNHFPKNYSEILNSSKTTKLEKNDLNFELVNRFEELKYISSSKDEGDSLRIYKRKKNQ